MEQVNEPVLVEDLLQYASIRKVKCVANKTLVLVDEPNTLLIYSKKNQVQDHLRRLQERRAKAVRSLAGLDLGGHHFTSPFKQLNQAEQEEDGE